METLAEKMVALRSAYDLVDVELCAQWRGMLTFSDHATTASVFRGTTHDAVIAAARGLGLAPGEMKEFIRRASVQLAYWMLNQERSGIPIVMIADAAIDVGRHELLTPLQMHFARLSDSNTVAKSLCILQGELSAVENQLKVGARLACQRARRGLRTRPSGDDIIAVDGALSASLRGIFVDTTEAAREGLESACDRIYECGSMKLSKDEFFLSVGHLPSSFVAEVAYYRLRHVLMTFIENTYCR